MNEQSPRIIYAGTPDFAVPALSALIDNGYEVVAVYTQPDRRAGRGRKLVAGPVKARALEQGLTVEQPLTLKDADVQARLAAYNADLMVVAAYGLILPQAVLDTPRLGCINIHGSLLPRWRGAAPIQRAIEAGDTETGITIMQMDAGLDTGAMLLKRACDISSTETAADLHDELAVLGAEALLAALPGLLAEELVGTPQMEAGATYAAKLEKSEAAIDWATPAAVIHRKICAFNAWPVAQTRFNGEPLRLWESTVIDATANGKPGEVMAIDEGVDVATAAGVVRLLKVQLPGKKPVSVRDFVNGSDVAVGVCFD